jgi:hypothetical protein
MAFEDSIKLLAAILAATILGVNLSIVRPMKDRMEELKQQVAEMQSEVQLLVGERDQVRNTNDLLSGLKTQGPLFEEARHTLTAMREMREQMVTECQKTSEALASVEQLATLQQTVLRHRELTEPATKVLAEMVGIQKQLIDQQATADDSADALDQLATLKRNLMAEAIDANVAESGLSKLAGLKSQILNDTENAEDLTGRTKQLIDLKNLILQESDDLDAAAESVDGLLGLKDQVVVRGGGIADAQQNAERLLSLRDRLADKENIAKVEAAEKSATRLLEIHKKLADKNPDLVDAVKSVETLIDIQHEFQKQIRSLDGMRRNLMEIVLMENTVARAVRLLQPLLDLGNLRHLNEDDLRQIARSLSEQNATRLSNKESVRDSSRAGEPSLGPSQYNMEQKSEEKKSETPRAEDSVPWPVE